MRISYQHRKACALCSLLLLLAGSLPSTVLSQAQPPAPALTQEQKTEMDALDRQASQAYSKGDLKTAETLWQQGLEKATKLNHAGYMARFLHNLAIVYATQGQKDKALPYFTRALALIERIGNPTNIADALNNLGVFYSDLGQYDKALDYYNQALALKEKIGNSASIASTLNNLGAVYGDLGQKDKALDYFTRALALTEKMGNPENIADALNNLGVFYSDLGQYDKALDYFTRALALREKIGNPTDIARTLNSLGNLYSELGQNDKALDYFTRALALQEKIGNPADIARTLHNLGHVYSALGQKDKALDYYTRALTLREKTGNPADIALTLNNLGVVYSYLGRLDQAETAFDRSRRLQEELSLQVGDPSRVGDLQETFRHFYERYAQLRLQRHLPEEALEMLETGRGQGLARQIDLSERGDLTRFFTPDERQTLQERTQSLRNALVRQRSAEQQTERMPEASREAFTKQAEIRKIEDQQAMQAYDLFRDSLFARYPQLREAAENRPAKFARLKTLARDHPDTLYLEWGITGDKATLLFTLGDKDGLKPLTLPTGESELRELARRWREALETAGGRRAQNVNADLKDSSKADEATLAKQAYQALLGEAEKAGLLTKGRYARLVLVGSGPLLEMPLAALCDASGKRLIERYPLSYAFSLSSFFYRANPERPTASLLCIADPTGQAEPAQARAAARKKPTTEDTEVTKIVLRPALNNQHQHQHQHQSPPSAFRAGFLPLPGARAEGKAVAALFAGSKLLTGSEAREETVTAQMKDYALLHFATHGYLIPNAIQSSGLVLAEEPTEAEEPGVETGTGAAAGNPATAPTPRQAKADTQNSYDGLLTVRKIVNLPAVWKRPMAAQLAVLSACESGRGSVSGGEGLMGLAWAFRAAGCPALVASQWQVNDEATRQWMLAFYTALKAGKSKDVAVQAAMLFVQKEHPSPYYWAAFQLIGDAGLLSLDHLRRKG